MGVGLGWRGLGGGVGGCGGRGFKHIFKEKIETNCGIKFLVKKKTILLTNVSFIFLRVKYLHNYYLYNIIIIYIIE